MRIVNKIITIVFVFIAMSFPLMAETIEGQVNFTWDKLSQTERNLDIAQIKEKIFTENIVYEYDKEVFKKELVDYKKDSNYKMNIIAAKLGKTNLLNRVIVPFYAKKILYGYGVIQKSDLKRCYYYTALGGLFIVEIFEKNYNDYPVVSYQYDTKGRLTSVVYSLSEFDEYMYSADGIFLGRWYKENYYNFKGKVMMTRVLE